MQKIGETENRQLDIQYGMIFMLGGLWAAHFTKERWPKRRNRERMLPYSQERLDGVPDYRKDTDRIGTITKTYWSEGVLR